MSYPIAKISEGPMKLKDFRSRRFLSGTKEFLESNSVVAKFAFILFVLLMFILLLRIGTSILTYLYTPSQNPVLIDGMIDAKHLVMIPQDPATPGAKPIMRSKNQADGLVFTWSVWILIDDLQYKKNEYKHIFHKGNDNVNTTSPPIGMVHPNNAPGLYIDPNTNDLIVVMNTFNNIMEEVRVEDIPINKWINVIIRVDDQNKLDVYINGRLAKRHVLSSVPKQNYGNVYVAMNGGFSGYISDLKYFSKALGTRQIQNIADNGPNMKMSSDSSMDKSKPQYLSNRWFMSDILN